MRRLGDGSSLEQPEQLQPAEEDDSRTSALEGGLSDSPALTILLITERVGKSAAATPAEVLACPALGKALCGPCRYHHAARIATAWKLWPVVPAV
jgi:hypothetical protein